MERLAYVLSKPPAPRGEAFADAPLDRSGPESEGLGPVRRQRIQRDAVVPDVPVDQQLGERLICPGTL